MKRHNIELLIAFLHALLRRDEEALHTMLDTAAVWQGYKPEYLCDDAREVVDMFLQARAVDVDIETIELIAAPRHAILSVSWPQIVHDERDFVDGIYSVFAIRDGQITRIDDYERREDALAAAGIAQD